MKRESRSDEDWQLIVDRLGGAAALAVSARRTKAFVRPREVGDAVMLLRLILAYCLGHGGLRTTAAWSVALGLVDISNVGLLYRLRQSGAWLAHLVGVALSRASPQAAHGRPIRIIDGTTVAQAGGAGVSNRLWRIHAGFDLASERFGDFELTDESIGERLDLFAVRPGEIRIADRAYLQADRIAHVVEHGADVVIRAGWKGARWRDADGEPLDLVTELAGAQATRIDRPIRLARKSAAPVAARLIAVRKPAEAAEAARRKARRASQRGGHTLAAATLVAADWVILVTTLPAESCSADDVLALYRLRWRIELAFKRLKSVIGLAGPPGKDARSARPYILAHLLAILLLEPFVDALEDSPRSGCAA